MKKPGPLMKSNIGANYLRYFGGVVSIVTL